jgi:hypothetical protein
MIVSLFTETVMKVSDKLKIKKESSVVLKADSSGSNKPSKFLIQNLVEINVPFKAQSHHVQVQSS